MSVKRSPRNEEEKREMAREPEPVPVKARVVRVPITSAAKLDLGPSGFQYSNVMPAFTQAEFAVEQGLLVEVPDKWVVGDRLDDQQKEVERVLAYLAAPLDAAVVDRLQAIMATIRAKLVDEL
jgi:hypothetical protein